MKKFSYLLVLMVTALILAACGSESKEDVIDSIEENMDDVESYYMEVELDIEAFDADDTLIDESVATLNVNVDESTGESSGEMIQDDQVVNYYATSEGTYAQLDGSPWEDMTGAEEQFDQSDTEYGDVADVIIALKDDEDFEMETEDDTFTFTFEGKSEDVYDALEGPYSLMFTGVEKEDIEHDLTIVVDRETYYVDSLQANLVAENEGEKLDMQIDHFYEDINAIDELTIPADVIEEAEAGAEADAEEDLFDEDEEEQEETASEDDGELKERAFRAEEEGIQSTITYYYQGDDVQKQTTENVINYDALGIGSKDEAAEVFDPESEKFQGVEGITHEMVYEDDRAIEILEIDYIQVDFDEAQNLPGMQFEDGAAEYGISMEKSAELILQQGFEEIE